MVAGRGTQIAYDPSLLGECVRIRRRALGLGQPELTARLNAQPSATRNYSLPWLSRLENGAIRRQLTDAVLGTLADALEIEVDVLDRAYLGDIGRKTAADNLLPLQAQGLHIRHPFLEAMFGGSGIIGVLTTGQEVDRQVVRGMDVVMLAMHEDPTQQIVLIAAPGQESIVAAYRASFDQLIDLTRSKPF